MTSTSFASRFEQAWKNPTADGLAALLAEDVVLIHAERIVYFDQLRLMLGVLKHPSLWPGYLKYRFGT